MKSIIDYIFRLIVWFVSHCNAHSGRDQIVKDLYQSLQSLQYEKFSNSTPLEASTYGRCGTSIIKKGSQEEKRELSSNKFYLSFENSKCPGYVTEKLYKIINKDISENPPVPVVMGATKDWYTSNLPSNSFIHIDDYKSTHELAKHLILLNSNNSEYLKYLEWRKYFKKVRLESIGCQLCTNIIEKLRNGETFVIRNFTRFWNKAKCENKFNTTNFVGNPIS